MTATALSTEENFCMFSGVQSDERRNQLSRLWFSGAITSCFSGTEGTRLDKRFLRDQELLDVDDPLAALRQLQSNWDSHGGLPPAAMALDNADGAIQQLAKRDVYPSKISPTDDGGIIFEYSYSGSNYYWEFESDGDIGLLKRSDHKEEAVDFSREEIPDVVARMHNG